MVRGAAGAELVRDDHPWHRPRGLQQPAEETPGQGLVARVLDKDAVSVDGPPRNKNGSAISVSVTRSCLSDGRDHPDLRQSSDHGLTRLPGQIPRRPTAPKFFLSERGGLQGW